MEDFKDSVKRGFSACKLDIESLKEENHTLKLQVKEQEFLLKELQTTISHKDKEQQEIKAQLKGLEIAMEYIKEFTSKQESLELQEQETSTPSPQKITYSQQQSQVEQVSRTPRRQKINPSEIEDPYEALLAFKAKANKREMLKSKLISMISEQGQNLSELKFLFVDHFKYCSKATFYNYLKELELEKKILVERSHSKNIVFVNSQNQMQQHNF